MEQKLPVHKNRDNLHNPLMLWNLPRLRSFWDPLRFNPFWDEDVFDITRKNMNQMLDDFSEGMPIFFGNPQPQVTEDRNSLRIDMNVPGLKADDIDVSADGDILTISADKQEKKEGTESRYSFSYSVALPEGANIDEADVSFANHRLKIEIPKNEGGKKLAINLRKSGKEKEKEPRKEKTQ